MKFNFYFNKNSKKKVQILNLIKNLKKELTNYGLLYSEVNPDIIFCIGGDGTLLHAIDEYNKLLDKIIFFCINIGGIGFLNFFPSNITCKEIITIIEENKINKEHMLTAYINEESNFLNALNEFLLIDHTKKINCDLYINGKIFQNFVGTGICINTPIGSSGYSKTFRGAIIDSGCNVYQITHIGGINNVKYKSLENPLILNQNNILTIKINSKNILFKKDGILVESNIRKIEIFLSSKKIKFFNKRNSNIDKIKEIFLN